MKKSIVILTAIADQLFTARKDANGNPVLDKNGKEMGFLRVENEPEVTLAFAHTSGGVKRGASALVSMTVEAWEKSKKYYKEGMEIAGRVQVIENLEGGLGFSPKMAGSGENAKPCLKGGKQIYRRTEFDPTGTKEDVLVQHDNDLSVKAPVATAVEAINQ